MGAWTKTPPPSFRLDHFRASGVYGDDLRGHRWFVSVGASELTKQNFLAFRTALSLGPIPLDPP